MRGRSRAAATSKMERFMIKVNGWKPLTSITKHSILDIAAVPDPPLIISESLGHIDLPPTLNELLSYIIFNKGYEHHITSKKTRLISSIGKDIYIAATQRKWKLPKYWHDCRIFISR